MLFSKGWGDPFQESALKIETDFRDGIIRAGTQVLPLTLYGVGCEVLFVDGYRSRHSATFQVTSSEKVNDDLENASFKVDSIQYSPFPAFQVLKGGDGRVTATIDALKDDGSVAFSQFPEIKLDNLDNAGTQIELASPLREDPALQFYGGRHRLSGKYSRVSGNVQSVKDIPAKEFYVKSSGGESFILSPAIESASAAQDFGSALATGDFNCDGLDDLAVGVASATYNDQVNGNLRKTGAVVIYWGDVDDGYYFGSQPSTQYGKDSRVDRLRPTLILPELTRAETPVHYRHLGQGFGMSLAVGNFNRDYKSLAVGEGQRGFPCMDLVIGAPYENSTYASTGGPQGIGGAIYIKYGHPNGINQGASQTWNVISSPFADVPLTYGTRAPSGTIPADQPSVGTSVPASSPMQGLRLASASECTGVRLEAFQPSLNRAHCVRGPGQAPTTCANTDFSSAGFGEGGTFRVSALAYTHNRTALFGSRIATGDVNK